MKRYGNFYVEVDHFYPYLIHIKQGEGPDESDNERCAINLHPIEPDNLMDLQAVIDHTKIELKKGQ